MPGWVWERVSCGAADPDPALHRICSDPDPASHHAGIARVPPSLAVCPLRAVTCSACPRSNLGVFELLEHRARAARSPTLVLSTGRLLALSLCGAEGGKCCRPGAAPVESGMAEIRSCPGILRMGLSFCYLLAIFVFFFFPPKN